MLPNPHRSFKAARLLATDGLKPRGKQMRDRLRGEQPCLLRIRTKPAGNAEEEPRFFVRRHREPVERERDVRPHRLALPVGEGTVIAAAARMCGQSFVTRTRGKLSCGSRPDWYAPRHAPRRRFAAQPYPGFAADPDGHSGRCEAGTWERDVAGANLHPVPAPASDCRRDGRRAVLGVLEMPRVRHVRLDKGRLEEARVEVAHHLGGADRREIGGALVPPLGTEGVAEGEQHDRPRKQHTDDREHQ
jgi:hypothetical protein